MRDPFWFRAFVFVFGIMLPCILFGLAIAHYFPQIFH
jgi:hypothetical protein